MGRRSARDDDEDVRDLTPAARLLRSRKRAHKVIDFPGLEGERVALVVPCDDEIAAAQSEALKFLTSDLKLDEFKLSISLERNLYEAEEQRQILARALRDPGDPDASFGSVDDLRELLDPDTRKVLMRHLAAWMTKRSPEKNLEGSPERLVEYVRDLKVAGGLSDFLTSCDFGTLCAIAQSLADRLPTRTSPSSTTSSSSSSPSDSTSPTDPPTTTE